MKIHNIKKIILKITETFFLFLFFFLTFFLTVAQLTAAAELDIGQEIDFGYRNVKRGDNLDDTEFRQEIKLYMDAYLRDGIQIGGKLNSSGIMNSTADEVIFEGNGIDNLNPFFEQAYIKINNYYGYPVFLTFGKQPIKWAEGLLVNDNERGLPAVKIEYSAPYKIKTEAYHLRTRNNLLDISGIEGTGIRAARTFGFRKLELDYIVEKYESTKKVKRTVYGGAFTRNLYRGLEYSLLGYLMDGKKGNTNFDGYAIGAYGKFEGVVDPIGKGGAWIRYLEGSGNLTDDEQGFNPILSIVEADMIGDFYGRNREYAMVDGSRSNTITLSHSIANLSALRYALYATVRDEVSVFMIRSTYKKVDPELPIGGSITFGMRYTYSFLDFELAYTKFAPEDEYDNYTDGEITKFLSGTIEAAF
jgi:hypothetical protein